MEIYIVQAAFISKENEKEFKFDNLWAVENENKAKEDCKKLQIESNEQFLGCSFKTIYKYEKIVLYKES